MDESSTELFNDRHLLQFPSCTDSSVSTDVNVAAMDTTQELGSTHQLPFL